MYVSMGITSSGCQILKSISNLKICNQFQTLLVKQFVLLEVDYYHSYISFNVYKITVVILVL